MNQWMVEEVDRLEKKYGAVPPPWALYDEHPYSAFWRMGGGESHGQLWWIWWERQDFTADQKIDYFRKWPPPHCWLPSLIQAIWGIDPFEEEDKLPLYFQSTSNLGFGSEEDYERDLNDPKWLEGYP